MVNKGYICVLTVVKGRKRTSHQYILSPTIRLIQQEMVRRSTRFEPSTGPGALAQWRWKHRPYGKCDDLFYHILADKKDSHEDTSVLLATKQTQIKKKDPTFSPDSYQVNLTATH